MLVKVGNLWIDPMTVTAVWADPCPCDGAAACAEIRSCDSAGASDHSDHTCGIHYDEAAQIINRCREQTMAQGCK